MPATIYALHSRAPERRKIAKIVDVIQRGGVILYPSDSGYALGCALSNKNAIARIRSIRQLDSRKSMTFMCASLSDLASFALVEDATYRVLKRLVPGPYTFVLPASKNVPRFAQDPRRRTAGLRVPDDLVSQHLIEALGAPLISISALPAEDRDDDDFDIEEAIQERVHPELVVEQFSKLVDAAITLDQYNFVGESSVVDMTKSPVQLLRAGAGLSHLASIIDLELPEQDRA